MGDTEVAGQSSGKLVNVINPLSLSLSLSRTKKSYYYYYYY